MAESAILPVISRCADWCDALDERLNPVANRDLGVLTRKKQIAAWLFISQFLGIGTVALELITPDAMSGGHFGPLHFVAASFMICVLPLIAGALGREDQRNAELVLLTGMTPMRIALGKLLAVMLPGVTVLVSLAPYFLLRYFMGVAEPISDLEFIGNCIAVSTTLTAAGLAMHAFRYVRVFYALVLMGTCLASFATVFHSDSFGFTRTFIQVPLFWILCAVPSTAFFLAVTAASCQFRDNLLEDSGGYGVMAILGAGFAIAVGGNPFGAGVVLVLVILAFVLAGIAAAIYNVIHTT